jgi:hypothetical protein
MTIRSTLRIAWAQLWTVLLLAASMSEACGGREDGANAGTGSGGSSGATPGSVLGTATGTTAGASGSASVAGTSSGMAAIGNGSGTASGSTGSTGIVSGSTGGTTGGLDAGACSGTSSSASGSDAGPVVPSYPGQTSCDGVCVNEQTDSNNCGGCGLTCSVPCVAGRCTIQLGSASIYDGIAVDDTSVYYRHLANMMKVSVNGGAPIVLATGAGGGPANLAVDATSLYWTDEGSAGTVRKVSIEGGPVVTLNTESVPTTYSFGLAVDNANVYWSNLGGNGISIMKVPVGGGAVATLATVRVSEGFGFPIATDGKAVYWPIDTCPSDGGGCASALQSVPVDGGAMATLASVAGVGPLVIASANLYCMATECPADGGVCDVAIVKVPLDDGTPPTRLAGTTGAAPGYIAADGASVYYVVQDSGTTYALMKVSVGGGTPVALVSGQPIIAHITVDATSVYWVGSAGALMKLAPK